MASPNLPLPLSYVISSLFHVNSIAPGWKSDLSNILDRRQEWPEAFRRQFGALILEESLTAEEYLQLTDHYFASRADLYSYLRKRWADYFGYELTSADYILQGPPEPEVEWTEDSE